MSVGPVEKGLEMATFHYCLVLCGPTDDTTEMRFPGPERW